jgi:hypothetical protein
VPVTTLTISGADEAEILLCDTTATLSISGTLTAITGCDGYYNLTLTAAEIKSKGPLCVIIQDDDVCLPVRQWFEVVDSKYYDSKYSTTLWNVNVEAVSGGTTAADNLEAAHDGTGYAGGVILPKVNVDSVRGTTATAADIVTAISNIITILSNTVIINSNTAQTAGRIIGTLLAGNHNAQSGDGYAVVNHVTYGNSVIRTAIASVASDTAAILSITTAMLSQTTAILDDTNELQTDWANDGRLDLLLDAASTLTVANIATGILGMAVPGVFATGTVGFLLGNQLANTTASMISGINTVVNDIHSDVSSIPTATAAAVAIETVEGTLTYTQALRLIIAALAGKLSGGGTATLKFKDTTDTKDRITATVDANGNRTNITTDVS